MCEARDGQQIFPGHAYIAPGDRQYIAPAISFVQDVVRRHPRLAGPENVLQQLQEAEKTINN